MQSTTLYGSAEISENEVQLGGQKKNQINSTRLKINARPISW